MTFIHPRRAALVCFAALVLVTACAPGGPTSHQLTCAGGTFSGAVLGGFVGSRFGGGGASNLATTTLGTAVGAGVGANAVC